MAAMSRAKRVWIMVGGGVALTFVFGLLMGLTAQGSAGETVLGLLWLVSVVAWCIFVVKRWPVTRRAPKVVAPRPAPKVPSSPPPDVSAPAPVVPAPVVSAAPRRGLDFTAIDFETATSDAASACAVGVAVVRDGRVVHQEATLVSPPTGARFDPGNTAIHGITAQMVRGAPSWGQVRDRALVLAGDAPLVAHNAQFDRGVWRAASSVAGLPDATPDFYCTYLMARRTVPLQRYKLPDVADALGVVGLNHHDAGSDALVCALVALRLAEVAGVGSIREFGTNNQRARTDAYSTSRAAGAPTATGALSGQVFCFTGSLESLSRVDASAEVRSRGGEVVKDMSKRVTVCVVGSWDPRMLRSGASVSTKFERAQQLGAMVVNESDFLSMLK